MKKLILILTIMAFSLLTMAQNQTEISIRDLDNLTRAQFSTIVKKEFKAVINSSGKTTTGKYASADTKDGQLVFNTTWIDKNENMFSVNAHGGVTDGIFSIFNQTKINNNVGFDFRYNFMMKRWSSLAYYDSELIKLSSRIKSSDEEYNLNLTTHSHYREMLIRKLALLDMELKDLSRQMNDKGISSTEKTRIEYQSAEKNLQRDSILLKQQALYPETVMQKIYKVKNEHDRQLAAEDFEYNAVFMQWFSIGGGIQNNSFNHFDPAQPTLESQISKRNFTTWNLSAEWNIYNWHHYSRYTYFLQLGASFNISDNFNELSKMDLTDTNQFGTSLVSRTSTKKITAYKGDYQTKIIGGKVFLEYYKFLWDNNTAFHIYPEIILQKDRKNLCNAGVGFLYSFQNANEKEKEAKLRAELYVNFTDLTDNLNTGKNFLKRNEFGLRVSFPISFL
jgi:hypothetical protein